ncbi:MCE family protein [Actinomadura sp. GC306]|uniref:MCE family protein n=1 Tax=Actinomadura sp. GC306 TaxID=2530367 RepID=UPI00105083F7|nr:MCE family protein [Actinomadura sp. GC306]TDC65007.1 MCE family protein [Actinomadura sp. GC306]
MNNDDLTARSRRLYALLGAGAIAAAALAGCLGVRQSHPDATYYQAVFPRVGPGLDDQSDVKIRGIDVGNVEEITLDPDGAARVRIRLDDGVRMPASGALAIQPLSVFGPKFIDLEPGAGEESGPYLPPGATVTRTRVPPELSDMAAPAHELLDAIDPEDVTTLLRTFAQGLDGRGPQLARTIDDGATLLTASTRRIRDLRTLIGDTAALGATLDESGADIVRLAGALNVIDPILVSDPAAFEATLTRTSRLSAEITALLRANPGAPGAIISSVVPAVDVGYRHRATTPEFITASGAFFDQVAGLLKVKGPHGTVLTTESVQLYVDDLLCTSVLGLCGPAPEPLPGRPDGAGP